MIQSDIYCFQLSLHLHSSDLQGEKKLNHWRKPLQLSSFLPCPLFYSGCRNLNVCKRLHFTVTSGPWLWNIHFAPCYTPGLWAGPRKKLELCNSSKWLWICRYMQSECARRGKYLRPLQVVLVEKSSKAFSSRWKETGEVLFYWIKSQQWDWYFKVCNFDPHSLFYEVWMPHTSENLKRAWKDMWYDVETFS